MERKIFRVFMYTFFLNLTRDKNGPKYMNEFSSAIDSLYITYIAT